MVKIRKLVWSKPLKTQIYPEWRASDGCLGFYALIDTTAPLCFGKYPLYINKIWIKEKFNTLKSAKFAAQTIYAEQQKDLLDYLNGKE